MEVDPFHQSSFVVSKEKLETFILALVQRNNLSEQIQLQELLQQQGLLIPQSTLSRTLKKLGIVKIAGRYTVMDQRASTPVVLTLEVSQWGVIVLRTPPGQASALAYALDQSYIPTKEILGSIAGDDVVLVIVKDNVALESMLFLLRDRFAL